MSLPPRDPKSTTPELRAAAEAEIAQAPPANDPRSPAELLHELRVHHVELEMQNESLRQSQLALEESRDRYVDLYDFAPVGYLSLSRNGQISAANLTAAKLLGLERRLLLGRHFGQFVLAEHRDIWNRQFAALMAKIGQRHFELALQRNDGSVVHAWLSCVRGTPADAPPVLRIALSDLTERKQMERERNQALEQLRQYTTHLEQRVAERTQQLQAANRNLQKLANMKDEFLAGISHELRTPLNIILTGAEILLEGSYGELAPKQQKILSNIDASGHHLLDLINDVLDIAKIGAGKMELETRYVLPDEICLDVITLMKESAHKKHIDLSFESLSEAPLVQADSRRIKQILMNLLSNAIKFTPAGGKVRLEFKLDPTQRCIEFAVQDTGIGIAPAAQEHLFEPFVQLVQLDAPLSRQHQGTGLGLALVKSLTDLHGGRIHLDSAVGQGSRFSVILPWRTALPPPPAPVVAESSAWPPPHLLSRGVAASVLVVDDNAEARETLVDYLSHKGLRAFAAANGVEAIEFAKQTPPNLVLMDVQMPGLDGLETTRQMRACERLREIPVVALTALAMPGDRERCLAAGVQAYLSKPVKMHKLLQTIASLLNARSEQQKPPPGDRPAPT